MKRYQNLLHRYPWRLASVFFLFICQMVVLPATPVSATYPLQGVLAVTAVESKVEVSVPGGEAQLSDVQSPAPEKKVSFFKRYSIASIQVSLEEFIQVLYWRLDILITANSAKVFHDIAQAIDHISQRHGVAGFLRMLRLLAAVFLLALGAEYVFRRLILFRIKMHRPDGHVTGLQRFWMALLQSIPEFIALVGFVVASYGFYVLIYAEYFSGICPLFLSLLTTIIVARCVSIFSRMLFSPGESNLRLVPLDDKISLIGHRSVVLFAWLVAAGFLCVSLFEHAGLKGDSKLILRLSWGSLYIFTVVLLLHFNRKAISQWIRGRAPLDSIHWLRIQLAGKWYFMALGYIFLLWFLWMIRLVIVGPEFGFAFGVSLFIVPIFLALDSFLGWLLATIIESPEGEGMEAEEDVGPVPSVKQGVFYYFRTFTRILLVLSLALWVMNLWERGVAFSDEVKAKGLEVLVILFVAYLVWQIINKLISGYLLNQARRQAETEEDVDSEWGDAPLLDRGQTLLPLVRKFTGVIMLVMVILLVLSSMGVNIGPLLAGAGVVGIAIGFGAQKLVSDVLSGFFYLLDDAFRVGEYIKTSSISGAVERITLRNVMLRHHRGMLQIVPYSDLGAITNYMRGGIVVKFNLQFPYDTDVDQVRKVIKKVGIAMLNDPEFGKNFIKQVKSQGIREVADSVLTIRVKFTAHPGTHFLIRREAYRRITEALAEKGILYAHRKVIVEVPSDSNGAQMDEAASKKIAEAGAAAHLATQPDTTRDQGKDPITG